MKVNNNHHSIFHIFFMFLFVSCCLFVCSGFVCLKRNYDFDGGGVCASFICYGSERSECGGNGKKILFFRRLIKKKQASHLMHTHSGDVHIVQGSMS